MARSIHAQHRLLSAEARVIGALESRAATTLLVAAQVLVQAQLAAAQTLPEELSKAAAKHGCIADSSFFQRPGMVLPPYVYGVFPGDEETSAAFWCEIPGGRLKHRLVFVTRAPRSVDLDAAARVPGKCPETLDWWNPPGGLAIYGGGQRGQGVRVSLRDFQSVVSPRRELGLTDSTAYAPLRDYYDGVETLFYCHNGQWLYRMAE
jgi:hypothetical protein